MQNLRQLGAGVIIAIVSIMLVIGGIFLSLAESLPSAATPTQIPSTLPASFPTPTETITFESPSPSPVASEASSRPTEAASLFPTTISSPPAVCTPPSGWVRIVTSAGDTIYSLAQRYKTSADSLNAANCLTSAELSDGLVLYVPPVPTVTVIPCGPPAGWARAHVVQPGDNLYRIALSYGVTYPQLQRANCMGSSTIIYAGQRLWVPNIPTRTPVPGVTLIPTFPTETSLPTATDTTIPPSDTPTSPPTATFTLIPTATATPTTPVQ
jgi:LysM repeat protein